jgi:hypothetical protein
MVCRIGRVDRVAIRLFDPPVLLGRRKLLPPGHLAYGGGKTRHSTGVFQTVKRGTMTA